VTFLPIVERELRVAARRAGSFRLRMFVAIVASVVAAGILLVVAPASSARNGSAIFSTLASLAFVYCLLEGARHAADCLSAEKRDGTLGLLFLTDLRAYDIVLGKLAGVSVRSLQGLFAFLPVLSVAMILGGVSAGEFWRSAAVLIGTLFFSLCLGLCVSSMSREAHKALGATLFWIGFITAGPFLVQGMLSLVGKTAPAILMSVSPAYAGSLATDAIYGLNARGFWLALFVVHATSWEFLLLASLVVPRSWQDRGFAQTHAASDSRKLRRRFGAAAHRTALRTRLLDINPIFWLVARSDGDRVLLWLFVALVGAVGFCVWFVFQGAPSVVSGIFSVALFILILALKVSVASQASMNLARARQNGALELLLATPLKVDEFIRGQWLALVRFFLYPSVAILVFRFLIFIVGLNHVTLSGQLYISFFATGGMAVFEMITFVADVIALFWVGMWMGLSQKGPNLAFFKTLLFGLLLHGVLFCIPNIFIDLVLINWAKQKLQRQFRKVASERFEHADETREPKRLSARRQSVAVPPVISR